MVNHFIAMYVNLHFISWETAFIVKIKIFNTAQKIKFSVKEFFNVAKSAENSGQQTWQMFTSRSNTQMLKFYVSRYLLILGFRTKFQLPTTFLSSIRVR